MLFLSLHFVLRLWFEKSKDSRSNYVRFREIFQLAKSLTKFYYENIHTLSLKLNTLKRQIKRHVLLLQLMRKTLSMIVEKILSFVARKKKQRERQRVTRIFWQYWYDSIELIKIILSTIKLQNEMYFDIIEFVDENTKFWHFRTWEFFIKNIFDDVYYIKRKKIIISKNIVRIKNNIKFIDYIIDCDRVIFIEKNRRNDVSILDQIKIIFQLVLNISHFFVKSYVSNFLAIQFHELFLLENMKHEYFLQIVNQFFFVHINRKYNENEKNEQIFENQYFIRKMLTNKQIKSFRLIHQIKEKLEIKYFDRDYVIEVFDKSHIFLFYFFFVDDFEIHKNIYKSFKIFYLILIYLFYKNRKKIVNNFTLIFESHEINMKNVIDFIRKFIQQLNKCMKMKINDVIKKVYIFIMIFFDDMSQQIENDEFFQHQINKECRTCICIKKKKKFEIRHEFKK